jgi:hypothetical protein
MGRMGGVKKVSIFGRVLCSLGLHKWVILDLKLLYTLGDRVCMRDSCSKIDSSTKEYRERKKQGEIKAERIQES